MRYLLILSFFVFTACHKDHGSDPEPPATPPNDTTVSVTDTPTVYIAGSSTYNSETFATYWVNGIADRLPLSANNSASGIAVLGSDIYITTPSASSLLDTFTYWKNGQKVILRDSLGTAMTAQVVTTSGANVYAAGIGHENTFTGYGAVYYKNNDKPVHLVPFNYNTQQESLCQSIAVSGSDVYIAGESNYNPVYWKNQIAVSLPIDTILSTRYNTANSIAVSHGDTYVAGTLNLSYPYPESDQCRAAYWKNGKLSQLTKDSGSVAHSIVVSGSDVYIAGSYYGADLNPHACYWKNGVIVPLETDYSTANGIAVVDGNVYIVGYVTHLGATYWKNGVATSLGGSGNVTANAIVVIKK